jgi:hypothetical protein
MSKITTGLASASLAALALGTLTPGVAAASPTTGPASGPASTEADGGQVLRTSAPYISEIVDRDATHVAVNGIAQDATSVLVLVPGGTGGAAQVVQGRFSVLIEKGNLGKDATIQATGPGGPSESVPFVVEPREDDGSKVVPDAPDVHAVSQYDDDTLTIEGTVTYDPLTFDRTEVIASVDGREIRSAPDENGGFALPISSEYSDSLIEVRAWRSGLKSDPTYFYGTPTPGNYAYEKFPLDIASPASGSVVTGRTATFAGAGIPNSTIVVTRDGQTSRTSSTLCETVVAADGDWSCTSSALPGGDLSATVTETPMWASAAPPAETTSFSVEAGDVRPPALPLLSSVTRDADGDLVVRVISNRAGEARLEVGERSETTRGINGRFSFVVDGSLAGETATVTGLFGDVEGRSLELPLTAVAAPAPSPLVAPIVHAVAEGPGGRFSVEGTTSYFATEYDVPGVIAKVDGQYVTGAGALYDGAFVMTLPAELAGREVELFTTRGASLSDATPLTVATTGGNTAPETFPLEITSPAEGAEVRQGSVTLTGEGIPGSSIVVADDVSRTGEICDADVRADGTWTCTTPAPVVTGAHTVTVTETPFWASAGTPVSSRSFVVTDDATPAPVAPVTVTNPADPSIGYRANRAFTFEGTGEAGHTITVQNKYGTHLGERPVDDDHTWSWTRSTMGTSIWYLDFIQDAGLPTQTVAQVHRFAPAPEVVAPITVTNPADPTVGYTAGQAFTFEGTGTAGKTVTVENKYGTPLGEEIVGEDDTWSWHRTTLGSSTWHLYFTQDEGTDTETVATVLGFAPRR